MAYKNQRKNKSHVKRLHAADRSYKRLRKKDRKNVNTIASLAEMERQLFAQPKPNRSFLGMHF
jgi:hypothetical protein